MVERTHAIKPDTDESALVAPRAKALPIAAPCTQERVPAKRTLTENCIQARRLASRFLAAACAASGGQSAFARALGVSHSQVSRWADPEHPDAINLGDLIASGRVGREVLAAALAQMNEPRRREDER